MTQARDIQPGTFEVVRHTRDGKFTIECKETVSQIFKYVWAYCAMTYEVDIYAFSGLNNHIHLLGYDKKGKLPKFMQEANRLIARGMNKLNNKRGSFWEPSEKYGLTRPQGKEELEERMVYDMANPVLSRAIDKLSKWTGPKMMPEEIGTTQVIPRPEAYGKNSSLPKEVTLHHAIPQCMRDEPVENVRTRLRTLMSESIQKARDVMKRKGQGAYNSVTRGIIKVTDKVQRLGRNVRRNVHFTVKDRQVLRQKMQARREFLKQYRTALAAWCAGKRDVVFPRGTWWMERFHGARVSDKDFGTVWVG